jgi:hypothetical protein
METWLVRGRSSSPYPFSLQGSVASTVASMSCSPRLPVTPKM